MDLSIDLCNLIVFLGSNGSTSLFELIDNPSVLVSKGDLSNLDWIILVLWLSISLIW